MPAPTSKSAMVNKPHGVSVGAGSEITSPPHIPVSWPSQKVFFAHSGVTQAEQSIAGTPPKSMHSLQSVSPTPQSIWPPPKSHAQQPHADARCAPASASMATNPITATRVVRRILSPVCPGRPSFWMGRTA